MNHHANCLFSSILHSVDTELNPKILEFCLDQYKADPKGVVKSNHGGWQSEQMEDGIIYTELCDILDKSIHEITVKKLEILGYWININTPNSYNRIHNHPASHFSGVYYVQVPDDSGTIYFENPHTFEAFAEIQSYTDRFKYDSTQYHYLDVTGREGTLLMFPSYLKHGVQENKSESDRISISFNARVTD
tara:strand:- start:81 stop:650 length:570 start_codon:yes stop_codon:yes gene_type:complete